ncbi:glycosyltransferase family 39 protein [Mucilaginibacter sp. Bleaf8]|uniref:ArnT family glycosyltransferase n=1 Tax=Mucilaginibacter sp. Bleaf8 TaxID=2834430 RepID=UPI001BCD86F6|nr:phospholipid carrier-dependent glycosyltransferase [Mucilaginibacter sp. Bleaf8]MBS7563225.1 glycosyltransferase family 39 protein [Mucilaginibacter sp. Bleaf8]
MGTYLSKLFIAADRRLVFLFFLCTVTFFLNLGKAPIYILDEAKNAQCAREMLERRDWIVPTFNQALRFDKPPLHYFFMSAAYGALGVNAFAARFFSAICGIFVVLLTYRFAAKHINKQVGFLSGLILLASWQTGLEMRMAVPDPYLILLLMLALYKFYDFYNSSYTKTSRLITFYIVLGFAALAKGPVALLLTLLIVIIFLAIQRQINFQVLKKCKPIYGLLIISAISLPWFYLVHEHTNGIWTREFLYTQNIGRYVHPKEGHGGFFLKTVLFMIVGLLPATIFLFEAIKPLWRKAKTSPLFRFSFVVILVITVFFTLSRTKLPNYAMPCYPFLSILLAYYLWQLCESNKLIRIQAIIIFIISIAVPTALYLLTQKDVTLKQLPGIWKPFLLLPAGILIALVYQFSTKSYRTKASIYITFICFIITGWQLHAYAYPKVYAQNPVKKILQLQPVTEPLVSYRMYNAAFNFALKQPVKRIEQTDSLMAYIKTHPKAVIITREKYIHELDSLPFKVEHEFKDIFESHTNYVISLIK